MLSVISLLAKNSHTITSSRWRRKRYLATVVLRGKINDSNYYIHRLLTLHCWAINRQIFASLSMTLALKLYLMNADEIHWIFGIYADLVFLIISKLHENGFIS